MCLCCCNPEESSFDDPKSKLLSPEPPVKTEAENKKSKASKKAKKLKKSDKSSKVSQKYSPSPDETCDNVVANVAGGMQATEQTPAAESKNELPPEWNTKAAKLAAKTFVGMGLAKRDDTLKETVDKTSELNDKTRHYRSLSKKLREKQEEKLKRSKLPW